MQPEPLKQIADSIESDITACEQLIRLLHHERDLLAERAFEPLDLIIQEKAAWLKNWSIRPGCVKAVWKPVV